MSLENYEGTAIDMSTFEDIQPTVEPTQTEDVVETVEPTNVEDITTTPEPTNEPTKYSIDGLGELTAEEIKEFKQGYLRQSDYTRKTQETAKEKERLRQAEELFNYLNSKPHLVEALKQAEQNPNSVVNTASPDNQLLMQVVYDQKSMQLDMKLDALKQQYGEFDDVALLNKATELRTDDLEFVLKGLRAEEQKPVDIEALKAQLMTEIKSELSANKGAVDSTVTTKQSSPVQQTTALTPQEIRVCQRMGMSEAEYLKYR